MLRVYRGHQTVPLSDAAARTGGGVNGATLPTPNFADVVLSDVSPKASVAVAVMVLSGVTPTVWPSVVILAAVSA